LQSDVMSDGRIAKKFDIPTHRPANLGPDISLPQNRLLTAFRRVLAGQPARPLIGDDGRRIKATIRIVDNGIAQIKIGQRVLAFAYAGLLSPDHKQRLEFLERYLKERTVSDVYANELRVKLQASELSDDEFLSVVETLLTSQESFVQSVRGKVAAGDLTNSDLLPDDARYWDNLIAPWEGSKTLEEFLRKECEAERAVVMAQNPLRAFYTSSLSYCSPALLPVEKFRTVAAEVALQCMDRAASLADHFAVAGAFEICADRLTTDRRFEAAGVKLLDQLLGDMEQLKNRCTFFAAMFVMTIAWLAQHQNLRDKPPFWRRITAAAHASLVLRACGSDNADKVFKWAMENSGKAYLFSILLEEVSEPRWKPDWLTGKHLIADAFGRIDAAVNRIHEGARPVEWTKRVEKARKWIAANSAELFCVLPAIGESARRKPPTQDETSVFRAHFDRFCTEPSVDTLLMCGPGFFTVGVTPEVLRACRTLILQLQKDGTRWDEENILYALQTLSFVAVQAQDEDFADLIAALCIEKTRESKEGDSTLEIVCRLLECAGAYQNRQKAMEVLGQRFEVIAFLTPSSTSMDLYDSLVHLQLLDDRLSQHLGRALAVARLGRKAA
jgi:hypothetical protein